MRGRPQHPKSHDSGQYLPVILHSPSPPPVTFCGKLTQALPTTQPAGQVGKEQEKEKLEEAFRMALLTQVTRGDLCHPSSGRKASSWSVGRGGGAAAACPQGRLPSGASCIVPARICFPA